MNKLTSIFLCVTYIYQRKNCSIHHLMQEIEQITRLIKEQALQMGFAACGIAVAEKVDGPNQEALYQWINLDLQGKMDYLAKNLDKRLDPTKLVDGARSVICVALNYFPAQHIAAKEYQLAWYAYGEDYHTVIKDKLNKLLHYISSLIPNTEGRVFCDTAPLLEKYWAWKSGLGWIGKHTQLIIPHAGSTFFLGEIIINQPLAYDQPMPNRCGHCTRCLQACPTGALQAPYILDARRCLSYLTIENREEIPQHAAQCMDNCIYGCDRCQIACPWNRFASPCTEKRLQPKTKLLQMTTKDWDQLTIEEYRALFKGSAVKRAKYEGLMRNIQCAERNLKRQ